MIARGEEEEEEEVEKEDAAAAVRAPGAAAQLPMAGGEEVKEKVFGCLGNSHMSNHDSPSPLRRWGRLPEDFLGLELHQTV